MPVYMALKTCPRCGASVEPGQNSCPNCRVVLKKKSALTLLPYYYRAHCRCCHRGRGSPDEPGSGPGDADRPGHYRQADECGGISPGQPTCTIGITGSRVSTTIRLQVMTTTCNPGEITGLKVSINGAQAGTLGTNPGASGTFPVLPERTVLLSPRILRTAPRQSFTRTHCEDSKKKNYILICASAS